jgi:hypothetical protein
VIPPANATSVTWMLFVKTSLVNAACCDGDMSRYG